MPSQQNRLVFAYQTRVSVTSEQDQMLREYASLFGHVERTLYADIQKGKDAKRLKSDYLTRFGLTARQFNALRIQLQGKIAAIRELLPVHIKNLKTKIRKAKKNIAKLVKRLPGSNQLHQKRRRLAALKLRLEQLQADLKAGRVHLVNMTLVAWAARKFKRFNRSRNQADQFVERVARERRDLFVHWELGMTGMFT